MTSQFLERMSRAPDEELIRIAYSVESDGYQEEAIAAAQAELSRRGVGAETIEEVDRQAQGEREFESRKADIALSNLAWIGFILLGPLCFWPAILFYARGYRRKSRETWLAMLLGYAFWGTVAVLMDVFLF